MYNNKLNDVYELFKKPDGTNTEGYKTLFNFAVELANTDPLFVLKEEVAKDILRKNCIII
jgi:hypothetical protein